MPMSLGRFSGPPQARHRGRAAALRSDGLTERCVPQSEQIIKVALRRVLNCISETPEKVQPARVA